MTKEQYEELTPQQRIALQEIAVRNTMQLDDVIAKTEHYLGGYIGIQLPHIFLGIEKDGYTHS